MRFEPGVAREVDARRARAARAACPGLRLDGDARVRIVARPLRRALRPDGRRPGPARRHRPLDRGRARPTAPAATRPCSAAARRSASRWRQGTTTRAEGAPDLVITNAVVLDHWGVVKCDVGVRDGRIVALGKAGNPDIADGVHPALRIGPSHRDPRRRGPDPHRGRRSTATSTSSAPQIVDEALASGITTLIGGGTGPAEGTKATTVHAGRALARGDARGARRRARSTSLLLGKGNTVSAEALHEQVRAGAGGLQAARGLGLDARGDRRLPAGRRRDRRAGRDPHRHAQRGRLRRVDRRGDRRPDDPRLPHRGRGRRPRAGHHPRRRRSRTCCRRRRTRRGRTR